MLLGTLIASNTFTGNFLDVSHAASSPYDFKRIIYDGGSESVSAQENVIDTTNVQDGIFIGSHLYLLERTGGLFLAKYDNVQNRIWKIAIPNSENSGWNGLIFDENSNSIMVFNEISYNTFIFSSYDLEGNLLATHQYDAEGNNTNIFYSPVDTQTVVAYTSDEGIRIDAVDGNNLHNFIAANMGFSSSAFLSNITSDGYIIYEGFN